MTSRPIAFALFTTSQWHDLHTVHNQKVLVVQRHVSTLFWTHTMKWSKHVSNKNVIIYLLGCIIVHAPVSHPLLWDFDVVPLTLFALEDVEIWNAIFTGIDARKHIKMLTFIQHLLMYLMCSFHANAPTPPFFMVWAPLSSTFQMLWALNFWNW